MFFAIFQGSISSFFDDDYINEIGVISAAGKSLSWVVKFGTKIIVYNYHNFFFFLSSVDEIKRVPWNITKIKKKKQIYFLMLSLLRSQYTIFFKCFLYLLPLFTYISNVILSHTHTHTHTYIYIIIILSCRQNGCLRPSLASTSNRSSQVFKATSSILTELLYVCSSWSFCFFLAICGCP